jgi:hypothetical protein
MNSETKIKGSQFDVRGRETRLYVAFKQGTKINSRADDMGESGTL